MPVTRLMLLRLVLLAGMLAPDRALIAREYFVSIRGNDSADGLSEKTALAAIARGLSLLKPGDMLTILPGTYRESINTHVSGAPGAPITIRARYPGTVLMRGDVDIAGFQPVAGMPHTYSIAFTQRVEGVTERSTCRLYKSQLSLSIPKAPWAVPAPASRSAWTPPSFLNNPGSFNPDISQADRH